MGNCAIIVDEEGNIGLLSRIRRDVKMQLEMIKEQLKKNIREITELLKS